MFLPKLTEEKVLRACQTYVYLTGIGYCPVNYWVETEIEIEKRDRDFLKKTSFFKKLGFISLGVILGVVFVNMRLS